MWQGSLQDLPSPSLTDGQLELVEQCLVGLRIEERLPGRVEGRDAPLRDDEDQGTHGSVQLLGNPAGEGPILLRSCAHQGHLGVVHVQLAVAKLLRHGGHRPEVDHVERPGAQST